MIINIHVEAAHATVRDSNDDVIFQYNVSELNIAGNIATIAQEIQKIVLAGLNTVNTSENVNG